MHNSQIDDWHPLTLPSKGIYYRDSVGNDICPGGDIMITPWKTYQEEAMIKYGGSKSADFMESLLRDNVRLPKGLSHDDLLITDEFFILVQLRCISLTPYISFTHICPSCNHSSVIQADLLQMNVIVPDDTFPEEPISIVLPSCGAEVALSFMRVRDLKSVQKYEDQKKTIATTSHYLAKRIHAINGTPVGDFLEVRSFVDDLILLDSQTLSGALAGYETGYTMDIEVACEKQGCGYTGITTIARDVTFFRPRRVDLERQAANLRSIRSGDKLPGK